MSKKIFGILSVFIVLSLLCSLCACHSHQFGQWTTTVQPTCTQEGQRERVCSCGEKESQSISSTGHTLGQWVTVTQPTCTQAGSKQQTCTVCNVVINEETIQPTEHDHQAQVTSPNCVEQGYTTYTCDCGDSYIANYVDALGHDEITHQAQQPTCTQIGWDSYVTCSRCDYSTYHELAKTGHVFGQWQVKTPATCTTEGLEERICACNESETRPLDIIPHNYVDKICTSCGDIDYSKGLEFIVILDGQAAQLSTIGSCTDTDVFIPATYNQLPVISIGPNAFANSSIESVTIPSSVTEILLGAFYRCCNLTTINFASDSNLQTIEEKAFFYTGLKSISIPQGVTTIGKEAFYCSPLSVIDFSEQSALTTIGSNAFTGSLIKDITIPNSVTTIGLGAFAACSNLQKITLPFVGQIADNSTENVQFGYIFKDESAGNKTNNDYVPASLKTVVVTNATVIGTEAFRGCGNIAEVSLPSTLSKIESHAFYDCKNLSKVTISSGVSTIGSFAFGCTALRNVVVPNSVTKIHKGAFYQCNSMQSITLPFIGQTIDGSTNTHFGYIFGADNYMQHTQNVPTSLGTVVITGGTTVARGAFFGCDHIYSITLSATTTTIGSVAFQGCSILSSLEIPHGVTIIDNALFNGCQSLKEITIPTSVTTIVDYAFNNCISLERINYCGSQEDWSKISIGSDVGNLSPEYITYNYTKE